MTPTAEMVHLIRKDRKSGNHPIFHKVTATAMDSVLRDPLRQSDPARAELLAEWLATFGREWQA